MSYDICVVGNDEASFEVLNLAANMQQRAIALLPKMRHSAWLVTQALRGLISDLMVECDHRRRTQFRRSASPSLIRSLISKAISSELNEHVQMLRQLGVDLEFGEAHVDAQTSESSGLRVCTEQVQIQTKHLVLCNGVRHSNQQRTIGDFRVHSPESILRLRRLPGSVGVIGGEDFGASFAGLLSLFGVETRLVVGGEQLSAMIDLALDAGVTVVDHPSELVCNTKHPAEHPELIDCRRTVGYTAHLHLDRIDVEPDENGKLWCAGNMETWCPRVFGAGSVVGFSPDTALHATIQAERILGRIAPQKNTLRAASDYIRISA